MAFVKRMRYVPMFRLFPGRMLVPKCLVERVNLYHPAMLERMQDLVNQTKIRPKVSAVDDNGRDFR